MTRPMPVRERAQARRVTGYIPLKND